MVQADDWLEVRTPATMVTAKFEKRASARVLADLAMSYPPCEGEAILAALRLLVGGYRYQVLALHEKFQLSRPRENDMAALDIVA